MGLKSFFGYFKSAAKSHYGPAGAGASPKPPAPNRSPERQKLEAELLANMRKVKKKLSENPDARIRATSYDQLLEGLRRLGDDEDAKKK
jgi:hypothetical protein